VAALFTRRRAELDLAAELESHLQLHIDDNLRAGMTPAEARRAALLKLGGVEATREACRAAARFRCWSCSAKMSATASAACGAHRAFPSSSLPSWRSALVPTPPCSV